MALLTTQRFLDPQSFEFPMASEDFAAQLLGFLSPELVAPLLIFWTSDWRGLERFWRGLVRFLLASLCRLG